MIGRRGTPEAEPDQAPQKRFDDFDLRLGDIMRGERATMGKSLLDVQRELRIKASFIAAIENADAAAFETPGFVAGYVRSYSKYLGLDPEWAFETFCREANFVSASTVSKIGEPASPTKPVFRKQPAPVAPDARASDPFAGGRVPLAPRKASLLERLEPRAVGSTLVLVALIGAVGYGGWSVLREIQRVQVAPVDQAPATLVMVDPLEGMERQEEVGVLDVAGVEPTVPEAVERLYRPSPLDVPVMEARDGPIAALDPKVVGSFADYVDSGPDAARRAARATETGRPNLAGNGANLTAIEMAVSEASGLPALANGPRVTEDVPEVMLVAVRAAWVRVKAPDGSVLLEKILNAGDTYVVPQTEEPPILRTGAAGAVYFAVNGQTYGPAGGNGQVVDKIALNASALTETFSVAEATAGSDAEKAVAVAQAVLAPEPVPDAQGSISEE